MKTSTGLVDRGARDRPGSAPVLFAQTGQARAPPTQGDRQTQKQTAAAEPTKPNIKILATGGTIAGAGAAGGYGYTSGQFKVEDLIKAAPGPRQARKPQRRASREHRQPGHERRGLAQAREPRERAARRSEGRRHRHHARHRHDGRDRVLPRSRREEQEAGRARRLDATGDRDQRRWSGEPLQRRRRRREPEREGTRRARRDQ